MGEGSRGAGCVYSFCGPLYMAKSLADGQSMVMNWLSVGIGGLVLVVGGYVLAVR